MKRGDGVIILALALAALAVSWAVAQEPPKSSAAEPEGSVSLGPVEHVGAFGNTGEVKPLTYDERELCKDAPLNSFGPRCEGFTWSRDSLGLKIEKRSAVGKEPNPLVFGFLGFL